MTANGQNDPERNYPLNCWWVAASAEEVTRTPLGRWLLDLPVVLYRTEDGTPVALDNRCMHRWAPLSDGWLEGDTLVCPYHGARFAADGKCVRFPTQEKAGAARVRSYPLLERGPYIWIWMGDEARMRDAETPPDFAAYSGPTWTSLPGYFHLEANYMLLHENVLDLTHFNYVHRNSFKITSRKPGIYRTEGNKVHHDEVYLPQDVAEDERAFMNMDPLVTRHETRSSFQTPAWHFALAVNYRDPNPDLPEQSIRQISHLLTPESATRTHYWWLLSIDVVVPPEIKEFIHARMLEGFGEDRVILSAIQATIDRDRRGRDYPELSFNGDGGGVMARRALERILAAD